MAYIRIQRQHHLGRDEVKQDIEALAQSLKDKLGAQYEWQDDTLNFSRKHASGYITVGDGQVDIEVSLGFALRPLKGTLEKLMTDYLDEHLG